MAGYARRPVPTDRLRSVGLTRPRRCGRVSGLRQPGVGRYLLNDALGERVQPRIPSRPRLVPMANGVGRLDLDMGPCGDQRPVVAWGTAQQAKKVIHQGLHQGPGWRVVAATAYRAGAVAVLLRLGLARHHVVVPLEQGASVDRLGHGALEGLPQPWAKR